MAGARWIGATLAESSDPRDANDSTEPTDAAEPTDSGEAAEPIDPTEQTDPIDPIDRIDRIVVGTELRPASHVLTRALFNSSEFLFVD